MVTIPCHGWCKWHCFTHISISWKHATQMSVSSKILQLGLCRKSFFWHQKSRPKSRVELWMIRPKCGKGDAINNPPDRKPRVEAFTFVNNVFDTECIKHEVSDGFGTLQSFLLVLFCGNSMVFFFLIISVLQVQKQRLQRVPVSHFPSRNWDCSAKQRLPYSFCCSLQHVFAQIDVMPLPTV